MKASELLHKNLSAACPEIHKVRLSSLIAAVNSTLSGQQVNRSTGQQVTVTGLGRNLREHSVTHTKHDIKRMDRLVDNQHLHGERQAIYHYFSHLLIGQQKHPVLIVDWSPIPGNSLFQLHRLSIPMGGRTLTIYEECFEEKNLNNTQVHNRFLDELEALLPEGCQPIILSDPFTKRLGLKPSKPKAGIG